MSDFNHYTTSVSWVGTMNFEQINYMFLCLAMGNWWKAVINCYVFILLWGAPLCQHVGLYLVTGSSSTLWNVSYHYNDFLKKIWYLLLFDLHNFETWTSSCNMKLRYVAVQCFFYIMFISLTSTAWNWTAARGLVGKSGLRRGLAGLNRSWTFDPCTPCLKFCTPTFKILPNTLQPGPS